MSDYSHIYGYQFTLFWSTFWSFVHSLRALYSASRRRYSPLRGSRSPIPKKVDGMAFLCTVPISEKDWKWGYYHGTIVLGNQSHTTRIRLDIFMHGKKPVYTGKMYDDYTQQIIWGEKILRKPINMQNKSNWVCIPLYTAYTSFKHTLPNLSYPRLSSGIPPNCRVKVYT